MVSTNAQFLSALSARDKLRLLDHTRDVPMLELLLREPQSTLLKAAPEFLLKMVKLEIYQMMREIKSLRNKFSNSQKEVLELFCMLTKILTVIIGKICKLKTTTLSTNLIDTLLRMI